MSTVSLVNMPITSTARYSIVLPRLPGSLVPMFALHHGAFVSSGLFVDGKIHNVSSSVDPETPHTDSDLDDNDTSIHGGVSNLHPEEGSIYLF